MPPRPALPWAVGAGQVAPATPVPSKTRPVPSKIVAKADNPARIIPIIPAGEPPLKAWSFSSLMDFERCKYYTYLKRVQKIPEPERPLPPGKLEHANDRGTRIHDSAEQFVRGNMKFNPELRAFETEFHAMQAMFKQGQVSLEGEWGMSKDWEPAEWKSAWLRLKLDALVFKSPSEAVAHKRSCIDVDLVQLNAAPRSSVRFCLSNDQIAGVRLKSTRPETHSNRSG